MKAFFIQLYRWAADLCPRCGGKLNIVFGFGPSHALKPNGNYVWCPSCHSGCKACAAEDEREEAIAELVRQRRERMGR